MDLISRKLVGLALVGLYMAVVAIAVGGSWGRDFGVWFWRTVAAVTVMLGLLGLATLDGAGGRVAVLGGGPNIFGRLMGIGIYALFLLASTRRHLVVGLLLSTMLAVMMIFSGSRGAMVAFVVSLAVVVVMLRPRFKTVLMAIPLIAAMGAVLYYLGIYDQVYTIAQERVVKLLIQEQHTAGRNVIYLTAWEMGLGAPWIGEGLAGFSTSNVHTYPHNLFLELFSEGGGIGLALLLVALVACWRVIARTSASRYERSLRLGIWTYILMAAMFSGEFYDSRLVFILPLIATGAALGLEKAPAPRSEEPARTVPSTRLT